MEPRAHLARRNVGESRFRSVISRKYRKTWQEGGLCQEGKDFFVMALTLAREL